MQLPPAISAVRRYGAAARETILGISASAPIPTGPEVPDGTLTLYNGERIAEGARWEAAACHKDSQNNPRYWCPCWDRVKGFTGQYACCPFQGAASPKLCDCTNPNYRCGGVTN